MPALKLPPRVATMARKGGYAMGVGIFKLSAEESELVLFVNSGTHSSHPRLGWYSEAWPWIFSGGNSRRLGIQTPHGH